MVEASNQFVLTIVFIFVLVALIGGLWYLQKKYPEETLGEIISIIFQREAWTIYVATILIIGIAEAGMAASFHIVGQVETNPLIRFCSHLIIAITYTAGQLSLAPTAIKMFRSFTEGSYIKAIGHVFGFVLALLVAFALPVANLALIASGVGETEKLEIFFYWLRVDHATFVQFLQESGLPANYKPFGSISYVLATSAVLTLLVHPFLGITDSFLTITQGGARSQSLLFNKILKDKEEKAADKPLSKDDKKDKKQEVIEKQADKEDVLEGKKKAADDFTGNIEFLLNRLGYDKSKQSAIFNQQLTKIKTVLDSTKSELERGKYGEMVAKFRAKFVELDKTNADKIAHYKLAKEVHDKFQASPRVGGFGTSLKRPVEPKN
jgi:hypothetical protein